MRFAECYGDGRMNENFFEHQDDESFVAMWHGDGPYICLWADAFDNTVHMEIPLGRVRKLRDALNEVVGELS